MLSEFDDYIKFHEGLFTDCSHEKVLLLQMTRGVYFR